MMAMVMVMMMVMMLVMIKFMKAERELFCEVGAPSCAYIVCITHGDGILYTSQYKSPETNKMYISSP